MLRLSTFLLIVGLILLSPLPAISQINYADDNSEDLKITIGNGYTPLTRQEAIDYIDNPANREQLIIDVISIDAIEHSLPKISLPNYSAVLLEDGDLIVSPLTELIEFQLVYLHYITAAPVYSFSGFHIEEKRSRFLPGLIGFGIGCLSGLLLGLVGD